jgi:hypothetical protein
VAATSPTNANPSGRSCVASAMREVKRVIEAPPTDGSPARRGPLGARQARRSDETSERCKLCRVARQPSRHFGALLVLINPSYTDTALGGHPPPTGTVIRAGSALANAFEPSAGYSAATSLAESPAAASPRASVAAPIRNFDHSRLIELDVARHDRSKCNG